MPKTLLAVDDSATMRKVLEITFGAKTSGWSPPTARRAPSRKMSEEPVAVVIDTSLPTAATATRSRRRSARATRAPPSCSWRAATPLRREPRQGRRGRRLHRQAVRHAGAHRQGEEGPRRARERQGAPPRRARAAPGRRPVAAPPRPRAPPVPPRRVRRAPRPPSSPPRPRAALPDAAHAHALVRGLGAARRRSPRRPAHPVAAHLAHRAVRRPHRPAAARLRRRRTLPPSPSVQRVVPRAARPHLAHRSAAARRGCRGGQRPPRGQARRPRAQPAQVEAVLALSREVVERVVWEVVPQLAETIIKEEIARLTKDG